MYPVSPAFPQRGKSRIPAVEQYAHQSEWDLVVEEWLEANPHPAWRRHSDEVNAALIARWLPPKREGRVLKTDLFDEIAGDGVYSTLASRACQVCGMDVSQFTANAASIKYPGISASAAEELCLFHTSSDS